ncbi:MAG: transcriptional repressor [Acetatifactor sp.]|nr:transcriptional repressor [Acetatifactor sp.]
MNDSMNRMNAQLTRGAGRMQKEIVIERLRANGCRITKQRLMLLDIILEEECASCKEIFYKASKLDKGIGTATVYRMINMLEEIGAINRKNMYRIACGETCNMENACVIRFDDGSVIELSAKKWNQVIQAGLRECGLAKSINVKSVTATACDCNECGK